MTLVCFNCDDNIIGCNLFNVQVVHVQVVQFVNII